MSIDAREWNDFYKKFKANKEKQGTKTVAREKKEEATEDLKNKKNNKKEEDK